MNWYEHISSDLLLPLLGAAVLSAIGIRSLIRDELEVTLLAAFLVILDIFIFVYAR